MPQLVEAALATHPAVADCAVFGVADERLGQRVVAAIVVGRRVADRRRWPSCAPTSGRRWTRTAAPREVHVVDELPRRGIGKVDRRALVHRFRGEPRMIKLNGVSVARRNRVKPPSSTITFFNSDSPACAPSAGPCCASDTGTQISDDAP